MFSICFSFNLPESIYFMRQKINYPEILTAQFESQKRKEIKRSSCIYNWIYWYRFFGQLWKYHTSVLRIQEKRRNHFWRVTKVQKVLTMRTIFYFLGNFSINTLKSSSLKINGCWHLKLDYIFIFLSWNYSIKWCCFNGPTYTYFDIFPVSVKGELSLRYLSVSAGIHFSWSDLIVNYNLQ